MTTLTEAPDTSLVPTSHSATPVHWEPQLEPLGVFVSFIVMSIMLPLLDVSNVG